MTYKGRLVYIDPEGNEHVLMPVTEKSLVSGMEDINSHLNNTDNPHHTTPEAIGAVPLTEAGLIALLSKGPVVLTEQHYGSSFPENPVKGQLFFKKV